MDDTKQDTAASPLGSGVEREVRAHDPERAAFEAWLRSCGYTDSDYFRRSVIPETYANEHIHHRWKGWQAARPKRAAVGRLINLAAQLVRPDALHKLWRLEEEAGRTLGRRALSSALADADENLKVIALEVRRAADAL